MKVFTCIAPVNIAVIKYWGKRDEDLILPINDSISSTLSTDHMCAKTTIIACPTFKDNKFWLNGKEESLENQRLKNCLREVKRRANPNLGELLNWNIHICSENNFPTAAGLASSAAGYACLVSTLAALYEIEGDISSIARQGSGSACRSVYGGWVQWHKGTKENGEDSLATQIVPASHWPEMRILVLVVSDNQKKCSSTLGMKHSIKTSPFLRFRADSVVPKRVEEMTKAIKDKNFEAFAQLTMQDSNQFHAVCLDTFPPCIYMNDISHAIVEMVQAYNEFKGSTKIAYTFDAGPNACLYMLESEVFEVLFLISKIFPPPTDNEYIKAIPVTDHALKQDFEQLLNIKPQPPGCLKNVILTEVGDGPKTLTSSSDHLLTEAGLPKNM